MWMGQRQSLSLSHCVFFHFNEWSADKVMIHHDSYRVIGPCDLYNNTNMGSVCNLFWINWLIATLMLVRIFLRYHFLGMTCQCILVPY